MTRLPFCAGHIRRHFGKAIRYPRADGSLSAKLNSDTWHEQDGVLRRELWARDMMVLLPRCPRAFHAGFAGYGHAAARARAAELGLTTASEMVGATDDWSDGGSLDSGTDADAVKLHKGLETMAPVDLWERTPSTVWKPASSDPTTTMVERPYSRKTAQVSICSRQHAISSGSSSPPSPHQLISHRIRPAAVSCCGVVTPVANVSRRRSTASQGRCRLMGSSPAGCGFARTRACPAAHAPTLGGRHALRRLLVGLRRPGRGCFRLGPHCRCRTDCTKAGRSKRGIN